MYGAILTGYSACDEEQALGIRNAFMLFYERVVDDDVYCEKQGYEQEGYEQQQQEEEEDEGFGEGESEGECPSEGEDGEKMDIDGGEGVERVADADVETETGGLRQRRTADVDGGR